VLGALDGYAPRYNPPGFFQAIGRRAKRLAASHLAPSGFTIFLTLYVLDIRQQTGR
jgi:hypothetical protein